MIVDSLKNAETYVGLHPAFREAFEFLRQADLNALEDGIQEIHGKDLYVSFQKAQGKDAACALLEAHRKYIDIQFLMEGNEQTGWKPREACAEVAKTYDADKDIEFFADPPQSFIRLNPGTFTIFFPGDAHAPMVSTGIIHKCVVKVRIG